MSSERIVRLVALACACVASGCEFEKVGIPRTQARVALHGVLSASAETQVVLLERTRNGSVYFTAPDFDLGDPIGSDEGIAETGALIRLVTPAGDTLVASADNLTRDDGKGEGIYRFALRGDALERGAAYRLLVRTADDELLAAETLVPSGIADTVAEVRAFSRPADTVVVQWAATPGARSYLVRIETPFGPRAFFTDSTRVRLTGDLRNTDVEALPRVFIPGFPQAVTVSAVDSNFYDWYRSQNNALSGTGLINRVTGGLGVFGSLVRVHYQQFQVVAPQTEPVAGTFGFSGTPEEHASTPLLGLELYVESLAARAGQGDALSGRYHVRPRLGYTGCFTCGLLGTIRDGQLELALLRDWSGKDTVDMFTGQIRGDTIVGEYRMAGGPVHFVREP